MSDVEWGKAENRIRKEFSNPQYKFNREDYGVWSPLIHLEYEFVTYGFIAIARENPIFNREIRIRGGIYRDFSELQWKSEIDQFIILSDHSGLIDGQVVERYNHTTERSLRFQTLVDDILRMVGVDL